MFYKPTATADGVTLYPPMPRETAATYDSYQNVEPDPAVSNPVLTAADVTDQSASFVADPFMYVPDASNSFTDWHMFFEIERGADYGVIGLATSADEGVTWTYDQTVLDAGSYLSMPFVFRSEGNYYMIPNWGANDYLPLYKASTWPTSWTETKQWLSGVTHAFKDYLVYWKDNRWWLLIGTDDGATNGGIRVYYSGQNETIENATWTAHPSNPVVSGRLSAARGAGRALIEADGTIVAFFQDTVQEYGDKVRAYEVMTLTTSLYADSEFAVSPILEESGSGWNSDRMHHYDPWWRPSADEWRAAVDGYDGSAWSIGIYRAGAPTTTTVVSDDFESGSLNTSEWTGDTAAATVQSGTAINGTYSLQFDAGPNELLNAFSTAGQVNTYQLYARVTNATESTYFRLYNGGLRNVNVRISGGEIQWYNGSTYTAVMTGISANTTYKIELKNFDYANNTYDIFVDGTRQYQGASFESSVSQHDELSLRMGNATHILYADDVVATLD